LRRVGVLDDGLGDLAGQDVRRERHGRVGEHRLARANGLRSLVAVIPVDELFAVVAAEPADDRRQREIDGDEVDVSGVPVQSGVLDQREPGAQGRLRPVHRQQKLQHVPFQRELVRAG
jgi:hypothetical protein